MPAFVVRGVSRGQHGGSPMVVNLSFLDRNSAYAIRKLCGVSLKIDFSVVSLKIHGVFIFLKRFLYDRE
jgi:hypothetical protein